MGFLHVGLGHLNRMFSDTEFLRTNRQALLDLYRPSDASTSGGVPAEVSPDILASTRQMLTADSPLGKVAEGIDPEQVVAILNQQPPTIVEAQRAVVYRNLQRDQPFGMTFVWRPGYEYELRILESHASDGSPGWITVEITSRYPSDLHTANG